MLFRPTPGVGDTQGDQGRNATGYIDGYLHIAGAGGVFRVSNYAQGVLGYSAGSSYHGAEIALSRVQPVGPAFAPRRWGALACAYLGQPTS